MKIKILFVLSELNSGGAEKVTITMMRLLNKNIFDIHLSIINDTGVWKNLLPKDITVHNLIVSRTLFSLFKLRKLIKCIEPSIVFSTLFRTHVALYLSLILIKIKPIIIMRSPTSPKLILSEKNRELRLSSIMRLLISRAYKSSDIVLAQTKEMKNELEIYNGLNDNKIQVLYNPIDLNNIDDNLKNASDPFDNNKINILSSGRLSKEKGFDVLIRAFEIVVKSNSKFMLHIIGRDVGERNKLNMLISRLNLQNNVKLWGHQKNPYKFYYFSDLYVLSSYREGMPNTVLENIYLKKPVVATKCVPVLNDLIQDGKNGYLVNIGDEIEIAKSILIYKDLSLDFSNIEINSTDINHYFTNVAKNIK
jgi:glycosyltransferase involved in cell wall biosynthesis